MKNVIEYVGQAKCHIPEKVESIITSALAEGAIALIPAAPKTVIDPAVVPVKGE